MYGVEQKVCIGLAFVHARDRKRMGQLQALAWAKEHWMEFLPQMDTETGKLLLKMARHAKDGNVGSERGMGDEDRVDEEE